MTDLSSLIIPKHLQRGDKVAAVSLSWGGAGDDELRHRYEAGKRQLQEAFGIQIVEMTHTLKGSEFIYNNPQARADDLHQAFRDPSIKAVFSVVGGDDSVRIIEKIDFDLLRHNPKIFMGYSDATVTNFICLAAGIRAYNGPAILCKFAENGGIHAYTRQSIQRTLFSNDPIDNILPAPEGWTEERARWEKSANDQRVRTMQPQTGWKFIQGDRAATGRLIGGCGEVLAFFVGTKIWPSLETWKDAILFIENSEDAISVGQFGYNLRNLGVQGIIAQLSGILFAKPMKIPLADWPLYDAELKKIVAEFGRADMPIITQMDFGHTDPVFVVPFGVRATINPVAKTFSIDEPGCL